MGKLSIKDLQLTGVKGASKLSTDENGNVVAGEDVGGGTSEEALTAQIIAQDDLFRKGVLKKVDVIIFNKEPSSSYADRMASTFNLLGALKVGDKEYPSKLFSVYKTNNRYVDKPFSSMFLNDIIIRDGEELSHSLKVHVETYEGASIDLDVFFLSPLYPPNVNLDGRPYKIISRKPVISNSILEDNEVPGLVTKLPKNIIEGVVNIFNYRDKILKLFIESEKVKEIPLEIKYSGYGENDFKPIIDKILFVGDKIFYMPTDMIVLGEIARPKEGVTMIETPPYKFTGIHIIFRRRENREVLGSGFRMSINNHHQSIERYYELSVHKIKYESMPTNLSYTIKKAAYAY